MAAMEPKSNLERPWYEAYPVAKNKDPATISRADLRTLINEGGKLGNNIILVDLRRADHEGGTIRGSINLPAQSLYPTIPTLYTIFKNAGVTTVIWYCGSSLGRGNRAAAWFDDYIKDQGDSSMNSYALLEGIKGWAGAGKEFTDLMDEYEEKPWKK